MLRHTFCHLQGIAAKTEQRLWAAGLATWERALADTAALSVLSRRLQADDLRESDRRHGLGEVAWFGERLPASQSWRLFGDFRAQCAYLDIETTGMSDFADVTTIALYDGVSVRTYVRGRNLDDFARDVRAYRLLVTYNGKSFDLPVLRRCLGCAFNQAHIDLRYVLANLGLRGGLKSCERQVGIKRPGLEEVDGYLAVLLWHEFQRKKDERFLETLLAYNVQDVLNLETLMVHAHNAHLGRLSSFAFSADHRLPVVPPLANPHVPDPKVVSTVLRGQHAFDRTAMAGAAGW